jgi:hypothetical protein
MANYDDRLKDYVDVKERIRLFYQQYPDGRLVTDDIWMVQDADGTVRVWGRALAYRTPDDPLPGKGTSYMAVPGTTPYTRGSEAENVETSCWGRAIGALGIGIDKSIASAQEVQNKQAHSGWVSDKPFGDDPLPGRGGPLEPRDPREDAADPMYEPTHGDGLIGIAEVGKGDADFELRQTPDGMRLAFRLTAGRKGWKVITTGQLAEAVSALRVPIEGQRVTVWGRMMDETFTPKGMTKAIVYQVVHAERIQTPDYTLPAPVDVTPGLTEEEKAAIAGSLPDEAPSEPLFPAEVAS